MSVNTKINGQLVPSAGLYSVSKPIGMADIYSTEEKEIGLWVDNKPLYQKSIKLDDVTVPQSGRVLIGLGTYISNIDNIIGGEVIIIDGSTNLVLPSFQIATMSQYGLTYTINKADGIVISRGSDSGAVTRDFIATVRYTKTTDTPWSGKFVPQGYGYVSSGDIYSFEERQVGVFADGKPLYQKTVDCGALPANTTKNVAHGITDIDRIVFVNGCAFRSSSGNETGVPLPSTHYQTIGNQNEVSVNFTNVVLRNGNNNASAYDKTQVTIQYTKTTDVAGSGEYVPSGDKAVHYSTEEEVIGTWIDGSTLYRKVLTGSLTGSSPYTIKTTANLGIDEVINARGYLVNTVSGGGYKMQVPSFVNSTNSSGIYVDSSGNIKLYVMGSYNIYNIILEYTKTS